MQRTPDGFTHSAACPVATHYVARLHGFGLSALVRIDPFERDSHRVLGIGIDRQIE